MSRILVTGTLAIDWVAEYPGRFQDLPRHQGINLSITLGRVDRRFGGCAMNIAYGLALLGQSPAPFVFVGDDFDAGYRRHLTALGIDQGGIVRAPGAAFSSRAFIFTDREGNQFTGFHPAPSRPEDFAERLAAFVQARAFDYAVLAPDEAANMIAAARVMNARQVPFLCDPGQCLTDFSGAETAELVRLSRELIVNQYEFETLQGRCGDLLEGLHRLLVTAGADGSFCGEVAVPAAPAGGIGDPTGCGDAYRAGYVHAQQRGASLLESMRAGATAAAIKLESEGAQGHRFEDFADRYAAHWGEPASWLG